MFSELRQINKRSIKIIQLSTYTYRIVFLDSEKYVEIQLDNPKTIFNLIEDCLKIGAQQQQEIKL